ncbi:MAG: NAD(P)-dependent oxidoreductase [Deltaproteobacteria bacterium CG11_big_fil_rev_8_21_14_0_20_47_16]|nr:MAG: NAD(P)-dependent oxidoreductase [Deltaproteobacteria bacterium CG11_big_fil_rev_8_21_14_0_20_47_16]
MNILVTGATGYIGGRLVPRLLTAGHSVRCLARNPDILLDRPWSKESHHLKVVTGDLLKPDTLVDAMSGIDVAYYLVHSMMAGESSFEEHDRRAAENFARAAHQAGVKKIIYLGALGSDTNEQRLSHHLKSRQEVGDILRLSGIPVTEFRAAIIIGSGSVSFEIIRYLVDRLPVMLCPKWVLSRCQPIAVRDVLTYLVSAADEPKCDGKILEIGGKNVLTYHDVMLGYAKVQGLRRFLISVPVLTPRLSSYWIDLITPIPASIARPLVEGLKNDVVVRNDEARKIFPFEPMSYESAVRLALDRVQQGNIETIWSGTESSIVRTPSQHMSVREGMIAEERHLPIHASPQKVFSIVSRLGGQFGWLYANWAWKLRGVMDRLVGGVGMRRGRRDPNSLRRGDAVDFWRVETIKENSLLRLRAEMKLPGEAWLQFKIDADPENSRRCYLTQTAFFEPRGLMGTLYWYLLYPVHRIIFSKLSVRIRMVAEGAK